MLIKFQKCHLIITKITKNGTVRCSIGLVKVISNLLNIYLIKQGLFKIIHLLTQYGMNVGDSRGLYHLMEILLQTVFYNTSADMLLVRHTSIELINLLICKRGCKNCMTI